MLDRLLRKIYRFFFPVKAIEQSWPGLNRGADVSIDPSCILNASDSGKITFSGKNHIGRYVEMAANDHIEIGVGTTIQDRCIILGDVEIGNYCTFAPNVYISSGKHYYDHKPNFYIRDQDKMISTDPLLSKTHSKKVTIGDDCWLGINVVIMSGLTIGRGCVIGANSVVTKNLEPFSVVAGSPAKLIKKRLELTAKSSLKFEVENDLPNFYKGFFSDVKSLEEAKSQNGIMASTKFTLFLRSDAKKLELNLKKITVDSITLVYNDQEVKIESNDFIKIAFTSNNNNYHDFHVKEISEKNRKCILITSIETIN